MKIEKIIKKNMDNYIVDILLSTIDYPTFIIVKTIDMIINIKKLKKY